MRLSGLLRSSVAAACIVGAAAPAAVVSSLPEPARAAGAQVAVAQAATFSRIEVQGPGATSVRSRRMGQTLVLVLARGADPDVSRLTVDPPRWVKQAQAVRSAGGLELRLTLEDDADAKVGVADGVTYVNIFEKAQPPAAEATHAAVEPPRPSPIPPGGVVRMEASAKDERVQFSFGWAKPAGAAVFRRGDAIWIVFDAPANLDVSRAPRGLRQFTTVKAFKGADYSAVRIAGAGDTAVSASSEGAVWTITLGRGAAGQTGDIKIGRGQEGGPAALTAVLAGATSVVRLPDPAVGDTLEVVTALGPAKAVAKRREFVDLAFLPTAHGLAAETFRPDIGLMREGDLVQIGRPSGLTLSSAAAHGRERATPAALPQPAAMPALIDEKGWSQTGEAGFLARYNSLMNAAAEEGAKGADSPVAARMGLARFLVGSQLSFEAIGLLNDLARTHPQMLGNGEFRGLRGVARVMARRYKEAAADFSAPVLSDDPSSALWRSYIAAQTGQWAEARHAFADGAQALNQFSPAWRARFARGDAQAALNLGDAEGAQARIQLALMDNVDPVDQLATRLVQARVFEAQGQVGRALNVYRAIMRAPIEQLASAARLRATQIQYQQGKITPVQAARELDGLRYRWRGDATELETIRALGQLYLGQGRYREALEALRSAGRRLPDLPEAVQLQSDLGAAFRTLFLDGGADGLEPIQALALFYDFKELTPIGADGDLMVRRLVRRLVDVDLLDQAADLLSYQADNRLDGAARAQAATDLAVIYLMARKPEQALQAINASRITALPTALNAERRLAEGRALMDLGRFDQAQEVIARETGRDAQDLRAEISWRQKDWAAAAGQLEKGLGERWKNPEPLSAEDEGKLLRAGAGYSLAGDEASLKRLRERYAGFVPQARNPEALEVALSGADDMGATPRDFARLNADSQTFAGWVTRMKQKFRQPPPARAPAKQASAPTAAVG